MSANLDKELARYLSRGTVAGMDALQHPLVYAVPFFDEMADQLNDSLYRKQRMVARYKRERNFRGVVWAHERPYRLHALLEVAGDLSRRDFFGLLADVWEDCENPSTNHDAWVALFGSPGAVRRRHMMNAEERAEFELLPDVLDVYRGASDSEQRPEVPFGLSWTLDPAKAAWFARRFNRDGVIYHAKVRKEHVTALKTGRGESEVVVLPAYLYLINWTTPPEAPTEDTQ